jgi:hypothetical protein
MKGRARVVFALIPLLMGIIPHNIPIFIAHHVERTHVTKKFFELKKCSMLNKRK